LNQNQQHSGDSGQQQGEGQGQAGGQHQQHHQHTRSNEEASYARPAEYETSLKRKRSFTGSGGPFESP